MSRLAEDLPSRKFFHVIVELLWLTGPIAFRLPNGCLRRERESSRRRSRAKWTCHPRTARSRSRRWCPTEKPASTRLPVILDRIPAREFPRSDESGPPRRQRRARWDYGPDAREQCAAPAPARFRRLTGDRTDSRASETEQGEVLGSRYR